MTKKEIINELSRIRNTGTKVIWTNNGCTKQYVIRTTSKCTGGFANEFDIELMTNLRRKSNWMKFDDAVEFLMSDKDIDTYNVW